jgi:hypothetical protein
MAHELFDILGGNIRRINVAESIKVALVITSDNQLLDLIEREIKMLLQESPHVLVREYLLIMNSLLHT